MAKRMKLVPETWIKQFGEKRKPNDLGEEQTAESNKIVFPKQIAANAEKVWEALKHHIQLDDSQSVVYDDGTKGSSLIDLMQYFLLPKSAKYPRPFDSDKFLTLLISVGVDRHLLEKRFGEYFTNINNNSQGAKHYDAEWVTF